VKGIVLAGGTGSRLGSLTRITNKHLLPVGHLPMIYYPVLKLVEAGIEEILVVTGTDHMGDVVGCLGSGKNFGCEFTYRVQEEAGGIAQALQLAKAFVGLSNMCVILGDNIFQSSLVSLVHAFDNEGMGARICLSNSIDPTRFGVAFMRDNEIVKLIEKPLHEDLAHADLEGLQYFAVTGIYLYTPWVFSIIEDLKPSARNELEITDVNLSYQATKDLKASLLPGWWTDAGTFDSLAAANHYVRSDSLTFNIPNSSISHR